MSAPQQRGDGDLSWLFQLIAVFVFFVLPVLRSIAETRKKAREGQAAANRRPAPPKPERSGKDLWRELLEGREPQAPARAPKPPPRPARAPKPAPAARAAPAPLRPPPLESAPSLETAPPQRVSLESQTALEPLEQAAPLATSYAPSASELGRAIDPATLDDELASRWREGQIGEVRAARSAAAAALLAGGDWRRAVLLSELLAPPLALRGASAAWPGPPAVLGA